METLNQMNTNWDQTLIYPSIFRAISEMGFEEMTPIQAQAIPLLMEGLDVIGQAQTGTGKTAAFGIPLLQKVDPYNKKLQAIILCPTRELAVQAAGELRSFAKYMHDVKVLPVFGGQDINRQIIGLRGTQIVVGTPGRVMDHMRRGTIKMENVTTVVLDEADEMLNMGFREDMEVILGAIDHPHQTCLFSATMPQPILDITHTYQNDPQLVKITKKELTMDSIEQYYYPVRKEYRIDATDRLLRKYRYHKTIIFCNTKSMVNELSDELQRRGFAAEGLHGDLNQNQRDSAMGRFRGGNLEILIATDIAARGIDVENVEAVINFDVPQETEYYVHRIGRTGRAGKTGASHTLCNSRDFRKIREIEHVCHTRLEEKKIPSPEEIAQTLKEDSLNKTLETLAEGKSGQMIPVVQAFCEEHQITAEMLAAAYLQRDAGAEIEDLPIDLPPKPARPERGQNHQRGRYSDESERRFGSRRGRNSEEGERRFGSRHNRSTDEGERRFGSRHNRSTDEGERRFGSRRNRNPEEGERRFGNRRDRNSEEGERRFGSRRGRSTEEGERRSGNRQNEKNEKRQAHKNMKKQSQNVLQKALHDVKHNARHK